MFSEMPPAGNRCENTSGHEPPHDETQLPNSVGNIEQAPEPSKSRPRKGCRKKRPGTRGCRRYPQGHSSFLLRLTFLSAPVNRDACTADNVRRRTHAKRAQ